MGGISVGSHGADLANYYFPIQPDKTVHVSPCETPPLDPCLMTPLACVADFLYRFEDGTCPMCALPELKAIADDRIQLPFVRKPGEEMFGVLWKDVIRPGGELVLGDMARDLLLSQHVVTAVETAAPRPGDIDAIVLAPDFAGDSFYFRVAPDATGDAFHVEAFAQGGGLMSGGSSSSLSSKASSSSTSSSAVPVESALGRLDARVVYSRVMGGAFVLGGHDSGGSPLYSVEYAPLFGAPYTISGWLFGDVLAATLTRPSTPEEHAAGTAAPSFLWTVERDPEAGDVRIVVREITRDEIGVPRFSVTIDAVEEDYALATAWDAADTVLLTASERTTGNWALAEVGGFLPCVADLGAFDPSCFTIRAQLKRTDLGIGGHLFRGIYAEHDALVMPTAVLDESSLVWKAQADRAPKPALGIAPVIAPQDFRGWWVQ